MVDERKKKLLKLLVLKSEFRRHRHKRYWIHPVNQNRNTDGEHIKLDNMFNNYPDRFSGYTRMSPKTFTKLLSLVGSSLMRQDTNWRKAVPSRIRLYVILRFLSTGDSLRTISTSFSLGYSTVWSIVHHGLPVIWQALKDAYVKVPSTTEDWEKVVDGFYEKWNLPNCLGAIDGKHVVIEAPQNSGSLYYNYKGTFSIVLLATCDADYMFTTIDVGGYGKQSDGGIFAGSTLGKRLAKGNLNLCGPRNLPNTTTSMNCFFVGDEAFPLSPRLMRPYPGKGLDIPKRIFNYRLSRARRCIEHAFGILAARWRIFRRPIAAEPKQAENIVLACVALHNFLKREEMKNKPAERYYDPVNNGDDSEDNFDWRNENPPSGLIEGRKLSVAAQERASKQMRDDLKNYFMNEGSVDWQLSRIGVHNS